MKRKPTAASALVLTVALVAWWSCSGGSSDTHDDGGKDAGGSAGSAASGGAGATGGSPGGGSGGSGAGGGSATWGADPKWEPTTAVVDGCSIERLANASQLTVFKWEPCQWSPADCEQAVFNPKLVGSGAGFLPTSTVQDDGNVARAGLMFGLAKNNLVAYALDSGQGLDGFRVKSVTDGCYVMSASLWGARFAVKIAPKTKETNSGLLGQLGSSAQPIAFTHATQPPGGSQRYVLGSDRWVWWWAPAYAYTSVSALDGSGYVQFAKTVPPSPLVYVGEPVTTGKTFLFQTFEGDDAGIAHGKIMWSDGIAPPAVYLEPPDPEDDFGEPAYANSHVAFMRGVKRKDLNLYESTELWASPYSEDPSKLTPSLIAQLPDTSMSVAVGGWGRVATPAGATGGVQFSVHDLKAALEQAFFLPEEYDFRGFLGMSRSHLWVSAGKLGVGGAPYLFRFQLK